MNPERIDPSSLPWASDYGVYNCVNYFGRRTIFIDKHAIERVIEGLEWQLMGIKL
jgi:hypothetical protein